MIPNIIYIKSKSKYFQKQSTACEHPKTNYQTIYAFMLSQNSLHLMYLLLQFIFKSSWFGNWYVGSWATYITTYVVNIAWVSLLTSWHFMNNHIRLFLFVNSSGNVFHQFSCNDPCTLILLLNHSQLKLFEVLINF